MSTNVTTLFRSCHRNIGLTVLAALFMLPSTSVQAQTDDDKNFGLSLGIFVASRDTQTRFEGSGEEIDLEDGFGLSREDTVFRIDGYYKFNDKHRIDASWFDLSRKSTKAIETEIEWEGNIYPIDTEVNAVFDLGIYKLAYTWSFLRRDTGFLGLSAGLYIMDIGISLDGPILDQRNAADLTAPLPVIGLRGEYYFTEKWTLRGSAELFALEYNDWDGSLYDLYAGVDYQALDWMAVGLGVNSVLMDLNVTKDNFAGSLDWGYTGALLYFKFVF